MSTLVKSFIGEPTVLKKGSLVEDFKVVATSYREVSDDNTEYYRHEIESIELFGEDVTELFCEHDNIEDEAIRENPEHNKKEYEFDVQIDTELVYTQDQRVLIKAGIIKVYNPQEKTWSHKTLWADITDILTADALQAIKDDLDIE